MSENSYWRDGSEARLTAKDGMDVAFAQSMAEALERAMDPSDVRNERVARVKRAIEAGTYRVPARELARKLVLNMLGEYR